MALHLQLKTSLTACSHNGKFVACSHKEQTTHCVVAEEIF